MNNPQDIITCVPKSTYEVYVYKVTDEGLQDAGTTLIKFCKGNKADPQVTRQAGLFTETLLATCLTYLQENNQGELANRDTSIAITEIENALLRLGKRSSDRAKRGVQGTYQK